MLALVLALTLYQDQNFGDLLVLLKRLIDPFILYIFARRLNNNADRDAVIDGMVLGTVLFSVHLALQGMDMGQNIRVGGMMSQPNSSAAFIAAYSCLLLAQLVFMKNRKMTIVLVGALLVSIFAEFQTVSRAGAFGLCAGLLATASLSGRKWVKVVICGTLLIFLILPQLIPDKLSSRFAGRDIHNSEDLEAEASADTRKEIWGAAISMTLSNPLGIGLGGFQRRIGDYGGPQGRDAHNTYLLVSSEMGVGGLLILLGMMYQLIKRGWQGVYYGSDGVSRKAGLALVGGTIALLVTNFFSATIRDASVFGYAWVLAAMVYQASEWSGQGIQKTK